MRNHKICGILLLIIVVYMSMCGFSFAGNVPKLNIDKKPVYKRCSVDMVLQDASNDYGAVNNKYKNVEIIDTGIVKTIEKNQKALIAEFSTKEVRVKAESKEEVRDLAEGDHITVYGTFDFESKKKKTVSIRADHVIKENVNLTDDYYIYGRKNGYSEKDSTKVTLAEKRIEFMIPKRWNSTEAKEYNKVFNNKIYSDRVGKCYYINRVSEREEPEVFCIFYFNNNVFLEKSGDRDNTRDIEKEIINNICPQEEKSWKWVFPTEKSTSAKGVKFDHYVANYDNYRIEFVFTPVKGKNSNDNGGICVMMHMYIDDSIVPDDVLYVMNSLTVWQ